LKIIIKYYPIQIYETQMYIQIIVLYKQMVRVASINICCHSSCFFN